MDHASKGPGNVLYKTIFENTGTANAIIDSNHRILKVNRLFAEMLHIEIGEAIGRLWTSFFSAPDLEQLREKGILAGTGPGQAAQRFEMRLIGANDRVYDVLATLIRIPDSEQFILSMIDISSTKKVERELRMANEELGAYMEELIATEEELRNQFEILINKEQVLQEWERRFRSMLENLHMIAAIIDTEWRIRFCNQFFLDISGWSHSELENQNILEMFIPASIRPLMQLFLEQGIREKNSAFHGLGKAMSKAGETHYIQWNNTVLLNPDGEVEGIALIGEDVTEAMRVLKALKKSEEEYRTIFQNTGTSTMVVEDDGTLALVNDEFTRITGYSADEVQASKKFMEMVYPEDLPMVLESHQKRRLNPDAPMTPYEYRFVRKNGDVRWGLLRGQLFPGTTRSIVSVLDITDSKVAENNLRNSLGDLKAMLEGTVRALSVVAEKRDPYTAGHQRRVAGLSEAITRKMNLPEEICEAVRTAATMHDIGKIQIPTDILSKPGRLTEIEMTMVKCHSLAGYEIVRTIPFMGNIALAVLQHHERLDGSGYPHGLKAEDICLEARILMVADVVEAMSSHRPYRAALGIVQALNEINLNSGTLYDPDVVAACNYIIENNLYDLNA